MASITSRLTKVAFGNTAANLRSLFRGWKFLKLLKWITVGQAVPKIPLSVGSKLELLLRAFVFAKFLHTSPYTHVFVCVCILQCVDLYVYLYMLYTCMYMTEVPRVLHFSAFIIQVIERHGSVLSL